MMPPSQRPEGGLAAQLLEAARAEAPSDSSLARALATIENDAVVMTPPRWRRPGVWLLAAIALATAAIVAMTWPWQANGPIAQPQPVPVVGPEEPVAVATAEASSTAAAPAATVASLVPSAAASASANASAAMPEVVAVRPAPRPPAPRPPAAPNAGPRPSSQPAACGCAPADLMCQMRCKGKK